MLDLGYERVGALLGGFAAWEKEGYPSVAGKLHDTAGTK
jgi:rhodanese-related sulfurtransferase